METEVISRTGCGYNGYGFGGGFGGYGYGQDKWLENNIMNGVCDLRSEVAENREVIKDAECNIRHDVGQAESNIRRDVSNSECHITNQIGDVACKVIKENSDQTLYLTNQLAVIREQGIRNEYETKLSREQVIKEVSMKVDLEATRTNDKLESGFRETAKAFCQLTEVVKDGFCAERTKNLEDKAFKLSQDLQTQQIIQKICCGCGESSSPGNSGK